MPVPKPFLGRCGLLPWTIDGKQEVELAFLIAADCGPRTAARECRIADASTVWDDNESNTTPSLDLAFRAIRSMVRLCAAGRQ